MRDVPNDIRLALPGPLVPMRTYCGFGGTPGFAIVEGGAGGGGGSACC
jgi:hypothetical protein